MGALHSWDLSPAKAIALQKKLAPQVRTDLKPPNVRHIAAVDVAYLPRQKCSLAACVLLKWPGMELLEEHWYAEATRFPYVPGLLSFREIPAVLGAFEQLSTRPDVIFVDGHGRAHPRRFGIATHLGFWLKVPSIGIGKSRLCGEYRAPAAEKGAVSPLFQGDELIGMILRSRTNVKPIYVSSGWGLSLQQSLEWTESTLTRFRLPEPIRIADRLSKRAKLLWLDERSLRNPGERSV